MKNHFSVQEATEALERHRQTFDDPRSHPACFANVLQHGTLEVELYQPVGADQQQPHSKDEIYVIATGSGNFMMTGRPTCSVQPGDMLFVPAGTEHRFIDFTEDFSTWVFLYGPDGGEKPAG